MTFEFTTYGANIQPISRKKLGDFYLSCAHIQGDPEKVFRIYIESPCGLQLELTPSKGMSLRDCSYQGRQMFWEPPMENLPDPELVDIMSTVICDGTAVPGLGWIRYFASHVEMMGLHNWGVGRENGEEGPYPLHGNVSNIPIEKVIVEVFKDRIRLTGSYQVYGANSIFPAPGDSPDFEIKKQIELLSHEPTIFQKDTIRNLTDRTLVPDWGYHVQLRPEPGCHYLIPAKSVEERFGEAVPEGHNKWVPAVLEQVREERGYIYKDLFVENVFSDGTSGVRTLLKYEENPGIEVVIPHSPYTLGWYSCGGGMGHNFTLPADTSGEKPSRLLMKNWDGIGPEIGSSDLDHKGNTDPVISTTSSLLPGNKMSLRLEFRFLDMKRTLDLEKKIVEYSKN